MENKTIKKFVEKFNENRSETHHRYASFDLCFNYFHENRGRLTKDMEKSCCVLWSYLASWGMLRGSTLLLQKNPAYLAELVEFIDSKECDKIFGIDIDKYDEGGIEEIMQIYVRIEEILKCEKDDNDKERKPTLTLITKIMLGVFGCIPAYDQYFCNTFKELMPGRKFDSTRLNPESLIAISKFYEDNQKEIEDFAKNTHTIDIFSTGKYPSAPYTKAKIIDMYGFSVGQAKARAEKKAKAEREAAAKAASKK
ncbi:MAG: hypothetical protein R3Y61_04125 [Rikenellaceae bacterium]